MEIVCDQCKNTLSASPALIRDGEMEFTFLRCESCGAVYLLSVTDEALRTDILRYARRRKTIAAGHVSARFIRNAEALKQRNIERTRELMAQYPSVPFLTE